MVVVDGDHSERTSANGINCERVANGVNSQLNSASEGGQRVANGVNSQLNSASEGGNSEMNIGSKRSREDAPKRGRAKMSRTELKMAPRSGKVELEPRGDRQFKYVNITLKASSTPHNWEPFSNASTQEHNFGPKKGGTLNTYAVMKSGYKTVDSTVYL
ncbi:uncharacterized protein LOC120678134 [Panicum virgatum]|uniref:uncharacterized protein LOC120678134 n=1 Tax=Panicum virgatum TaxID=38727 RepID=UPI0019D64104|nr:uncharacterized protein LOC120678134 [Panicum virgatum]